MIHHTPLPWSKRPNNKDISFVIRSEYSSSHISAEVVRDTTVDKHALVKKNHGVRLIPYIEDDVNFILHACNHYYEMLGMLNRVRHALQTNIKHDDLTAAVYDLEKRLLDTS